MWRIDQLNFRSLLGREYRELSAYLEQHPEALDPYVSRLAAELTQTTNDSVDDEHVCIIALLHRNHFSPALLKTIYNRLRAILPTPVMELLSTVLRPTDVEQPSIQLLRRPSISANTYESLVRPLYRSALKSARAEPVSRWGPTLHRLLNLHRDFVGRTGDAELYVRNCASLAHSLLVSSEKHGREGPALAEELVTDALRWAPFDPVLWTTWAGCYVVTGDFDAAELLFWEGRRRVPYAAQSATVFADFLAQHKTDIPTAILVVEDALRFQPQDFVLLGQLASLLIDSDGTESWERAFKAALNSAIIVQGRKQASILAKVLSSSPTRQQFVQKVQEVFSRTPRHERWLGELGTFIATRKHSIVYGIYYFERLSRLMPQSTYIANLRAKVVASNPADTSRLDKAIEICERANTDIKDNVYSRMQIITYLLAKGDPASRERALALLDERDSIYGQDAHSIRLRQAAHRPGKAVKIALTAPFAAETTLSKLRPLSGGNLANKLGLKLPETIRLGGELKKLSFSVTSVGDSGAKERLKEILHSNPTFSYAQLLGERYALWVTLSEQLPTFANSFERALRTRDVNLLAQLGRRYSKLAALCIVARVVLGDQAAFDMVSDALSTIGSNRLPAVITLAHGLESILKSGGEKEETVPILRRASESVIRVLYSANEAGLVN